MSSRAGWALAVVLAGAGGAVHAQPAPEPRLTSTCAADDPVPTPPDYAGWDRSSVVAWEAIEQYGGIVPEIEEDRGHAPPGWWRYPSALRSASILAAEARDARGLYSAVAAGDAKQGDILVRTRGTGACGKMAMLGGQVDGQWMTMEAGDDGAAAMRTGSSTFLTDAGRALRDDVAVFRIRVKKDETLGHVRELRRDLDHLERTIAERPPLIAKNGHAAVDEKVHDLLDEAWSLVAEPAYDLDRRELAGRALTLGAALDWPGAAPVAGAVLDDVIRRAPLRAPAVLARAELELLAGHADRAATLAEAAAAIPGAPPRADYLLGRSLVASGKKDTGLAALKRYLEREPGDPRAKRLVASGGAEPRLGTAPPDETPGVRLGGTAERGSAESADYGFKIDWPVTWRVANVTASPAAGLLIDLATGRVNLDNDDTARAAGVVFVQRPDSAADRAAMVKKAGRNLFPDAKMKPLPALLPGSRRELFREKRDGRMHQGEVTTVEHGGVVIFVVLNAPAEAYSRLKGEYATVVKSLTFAAAATAEQAPQ